MNPPILIYRFGNFLYKLNFRKISKFFSYLNRLFFGVWLPSSCDIGKNFSLGYWGIGIVIHNDSIIGNNVTISQNVTIGRNFGELFVPKIGNDVYIGAGTVIFGDITIGNNVIIGANSLINKSIPENSTVAGNPFFIIQENRILKYYELDQKKIIINK